MMRSTTVKQVCDSIKSIADKFLKSYEPQKGYISKLLSLQSDEEMLAIEIKDVITSFTNRLSFPELSYQEEGELLDELARIFARFVKIIEAGGAINRDFKNLFKLFSVELKRIIIHFCNKSPNKENVNLFYLSHYLSARKMGFASISNFAILKNEAVAVLENFIQTNPSKEIKDIIIAALDSIKQSEKGINQHSDNYLQLSFNLLKFLNTLRQVLIDQNEKVLLPKLTSVIDRALEIAKPGTLLSLGHQKNTVKSCSIDDSIEQFSINVRKSYSYFCNEQNGCLFKTTKITNKSSSCNDDAIQLRTLR